MDYRALLLAAPLALSACNAAPDDTASSTDTSATDTSTQDAFWTALSSHCGENGEGLAYAGGLVSEDERDADLQNQAMIAHWAQCSEDRIAIAFHIADDTADDGWDRSRTWLVTRTQDGLRLKHDHRHADGSEDAVTQYGGDTADEGTANQQAFPVDDYSIAMFEREGLDASLTNVWALEAFAQGSDGPAFTYQLTRRNDETRLFRVVFNNSDTIAPPPPAWGW